MHINPKATFILGWVGWVLTTRVTQWAIADGLGHIPKDDPETCYHNFNPLWREWLPSFGTHRGVIWMGTRRILLP